MTRPRQIAAGVALRAQAMKGACGKSAFPRGVFLRMWRAGVVLAAAALLHLSAVRQDRERRYDRVALDQARHFFPSAVGLGRMDGQGRQVVRDSSGAVVGLVLMTAPETDELVGYSGPNNLLVALDLQGRVVGMELLASGDTPAHVESLRRDSEFWKTYVGWRPGQESAPAARIVSGSTLTSLALAEGLQRRLGVGTGSLRFPDSASLEEIRTLFPEAAEMSEVAGREGWLAVDDRDGVRLGYVVRTAPQADNVRGYRGPTDCWVAVAPDGNTVLQVALRSSYDTPEYVDRVRLDRSYLQQLAQRSVQTWAGLELRESGLEGVSGATQTSYAVAEALRRRFAAELDQGRMVGTGFLGRWALRDGAMVALVLGGMMVGFSSWRRRAWARRLWEIAVVLVLGFGLGGFVSLALLVGWARHGATSQMAPGLVLLAAAALVVPWATGRPLYCHQLCPHGVVQGWLARMRWKRRRMWPSLHAWLRCLPAGLLVVALTLGVLGWSGSLAVLEPFDAWTLGIGAGVSALLAVVGLGLSVWVPMAYCRYGCPTGALLTFLRCAQSRGSHAWSARDTLAAVFLVVAGLWVFFDSGPGAGEHALPPELGTRVGGATLGTTWTASVRASHGDPEGLQETLQGELDRVEQALSHWQPESLTAGFNQAETTRDILMPEEFLDVLRRALDVTQASDGALDVTVAPLAAAMGFGPPPRGGSNSGVNSLEAMRDRVGWRKLRPDYERGTVAKLDPRLELDFGAFLQGYAADRLVEILKAEGFGDCLVEVGGELRAVGAWDVAVENPVAEGSALVGFQLCDAALATSGVYRGSQVGADGRRRAHVVDPRTGRAVEHDTLLVAVVGASALEADAWATALLVQGWQEGMPLAERREMAVLTVSVGGDGEVSVRTTVSMRSLLDDVESIRRAP